MCKELLSKKNELIGVKVDIKKFTLHPRNRSDDGENKTRYNNGVGSGDKGVRDKGSNAARIVVNARGMNDRAKRGLLVEMLVL